MPSDKKFAICCNKGKVILPDLKECHEFLKSLLTTSSYLNEENTELQ